MPSVRGQPGTLSVFILAYNLWNFLRRLCLPKAVKHWSLRSVQVKLLKMGGRLVRHARRLIFQLSEVSVPLCCRTKETGGKLQSRSRSCRGRIRRRAVGDIESETPYRSAYGDPFHQERFPVPLEPDQIPLNYGLAVVPISPPSEFKSTIPTF